METLPLFTLELICRIFVTFVCFLKISRHWKYDVIISIIISENYINLRAEKLRSIFYRGYPVKFIHGNIRLVDCLFLHQANFLRIHRVSRKDMQNAILQIYTYLQVYYNNEIVLYILVSIYIIYVNGTR